MMASNQSRSANIASPLAPPVSESSGYLFHNGSLIILGGFLFLSAWSELFPLVILLALILGAALLAKIWARFSLVQVSGQRLIETRRFFPGDRAELAHEVTNRKFLPIPWLEVEDEIPRVLTDGDLPPSSKHPDGAFLTRSTFLFWYRRKKWKYSLHARKRGYYPLGPLRLRAGDFFGFYTRMIEFPLLDPIIVYPKICSLPGSVIPSLFPFGDIASEKRVFQDPLRPIGLRDYQPNDNRRHIHWKASARTQKLQVKIFEPTTTLQISLLLAVDSFQSPERFPEEDFEWAISLAASLGNHLVGRRVPTGLFVNTRMVDSGQAIQILPGGSRNQILMILEALAKVSSKPNESFETFLQKERSNLSSGDTLVFILHKISTGVSWQIQELKGAGNKVHVFLTGDQELSPQEEAMVQRFPPPSNKAFDPDSRSAA